MGSAPTAAWAAAALALCGTTSLAIDFIDVLKHDLRDNNDDYNEPLLSNATTLVQSAAETTATIDISQPGDRYDNVARRFYNQKSLNSLYGNLDTRENPTHRRFINQRRSVNELSLSIEKDDMAELTRQPPAHPTPAYPTPAHPTPAHPTPAHPTPAHPTPAHPTPVYPTPEQPTPPYPTPAHLAPAHPTPPYPTPAHPAPAHPTQAYPAPVHPAWDTWHPMPGIPRPSPLPNVLDNPTETTKQPQTTIRTVTVTMKKLRKHQYKIASPHFRNKKSPIKDKINNFKKFMVKNKEMFSNFVSNKIEAAATPPLPPLSLARPTPPAPPTPPTPPTPTTQFTHAFRLRTLKTTPVESAGVGSDETLQQMQLRDRAQHRVQFKVTPDGEAMDMAPAKGGKIHNLRVKGRLCQRSVMIPEGPKYDSKGKMYLGPFTHKSGRDYSKTKRPKLVLPRCCNCCKKSVLGCE